MIFHRYFHMHNAQAEPTCLFLDCFYEGTGYTSAAKAGTNVECEIRSDSDWRLRCPLMLAVPTTNPFNSATSISLYPS